MTGLIDSVQMLSAVVQAIETGAAELETFEVAEAPWYSRDSDRPFRATYNVRSAEMLPVEMNLADQHAFAERMMLWWGERASRLEKECKASGTSTPEQPPSSKLRDAFTQLMRAGHEIHKLTGRRALIAVEIPGEPMDAARIAFDAFPDRFNGNMSGEVPVMPNVVVRDVPRRRDLAERLAEREMRRDLNGEAHDRDCPRLESAEGRCVCGNADGRRRLI